MTTARTTENFDCISFKRAVQEKIYEEIKGMTHEEEIEYFRQRANQGALGNWWRKVQEQRETRS